VQSMTTAPPVDLFATHKVVDVDTHLTEPPDVWTSRMSTKRWGDLVPHIENRRGVDVWVAGRLRIGSPGASSIAGWDDFVPNGPPTYDLIHPSMYDAHERLAWLDREGIWAQVLYPNVGGFGSAFFLQLGDAELMLECVRTYNDFLIEWCSADPRRLIPVMSTPFWDVDAAVAEIARCVANGHRAVNFCNQPEVHGQPPIAHPHWDPIWAAVQDAGVPISFHIGGGDIGRKPSEGADFMGVQPAFARFSSLLIVDNQRCLAELFFGGVCHRFPRLKFVSVESGVGWMPGVLEVFDWQWRNTGVTRDRPEYDLLPSEYFRRQVYGCFWFEDAAARFAVEQYPDNMLYETDYPHPTCQYPSPPTPARHPRDYANDALAGLSPDLQQKVLHDNAARLYLLD
jgi:uncharacterized protein